MNLQTSAADPAMDREIGDINLAYMLLAQKLVKQDRAAAMFRLGISRELADLLSAMSLRQIVKAAGGSELLCGFRLQNLPVTAAVSEEQSANLQQAHMSILMSARPSRSALACA